MTMTMQSVTSGERMLHLQEENRNLRGQLAEVEKENIRLKHRLSAVQKRLEEEETKRKTTEGLLLVEQQQRQSRRRWTPFRSKSNNKSSTLQAPPAPATSVAHAAPLALSSTPTPLPNRQQRKTTTGGSSTAKRPPNPYLHFSFIDDGLLEMAAKQAQADKLQKRKKKQQLQLATAASSTNNGKGRKTHGSTKKLARRASGSFDSRASSSSCCEPEQDAMTTLMNRLELEIQVRTQELEIANKNLEAANKRILEQSAAQLEQFACMSHEIRTPLNCIIGMASLMLDNSQTDPLPPNVKESLQMMVNSGELLAAIVNDVLDYFRLASDKVEMDVRPAPLKDTLQTVVDGIATRAKERALTIQTNYSSNLPTLLTTDARRLQQILFNLLGNAVKFSHTGGKIEFYVCLTNNDKTLRFGVKDYGKGIAKDKLTKIFEPFQQETAQTERLHGGTGLGLAITSKLVKALGGTIHVDSQLGEWSDFVVDFASDSPNMQWATTPTTTPTVVVPFIPAPLFEIHPNKDSNNKDSTLLRDSVTVDSSAHSNCNNNPAQSDEPLVQVVPLTATTAAVSTPVPCSSSSIPYDKIRVLVAEDNIVNVKILGKMLDRLGLQHVDIVDNGRKAVDLAAQQDFDLILMDMQMPIMDGLEATRLIRAAQQQQQQDQGATPPHIVFLTAHAFDKFQDAAFSAGADAFVSKPFNLQKIKGLFESLTFPNLMVATPVSS